MLTSYSLKTIVQRPLTPLYTLLHPRQTLPAFLMAAAIGVIGGILGGIWIGWPLWASAAFFLGVLLIPATHKWRDDFYRYGPVAAGLSVLLTTQGFHTIEHLVQWTQYHILNWPLRASSGILSPANSEWVHFTWNMLVLLATILLIKAGWRNGWAWLLFVIALTHTIEHSYTFIRYLRVLQELKTMGVTDVTAQGLPGIVGQGGWLALSPFTRGTFICRLPGLTTASRLDVHFWWNFLEMIPLTLGAHIYFKNFLQQQTTKKV